MKLSEINSEELADFVTEVVQALADFFDTEMGFEFQIITYTTDAAEERELLQLKLSGLSESLLIGYHGRTLEQIQHFFSLCISSKFKIVVRVTADAGDYRQKRYSTLQSLATRIEAQVLSTGEEVELNPMPAAERRIVHEHLSRSAQVETTSVGEGSNRRVVIKPKPLY